MENDDYTSLLTTLQNDVLEILRAFESLQENIRPGTTAASQAHLVSVVSDTFRRFEASFATLTPPAAMTQAHQPLCNAIRELEHGIRFHHEQARARMDARVPA